MNKNPDIEYYHSIMNNTRANGHKICFLSIDFEGEESDLLSLLINSFQNTKTEYHIVNEFHGMLKTKDIFVQIDKDTYRFIEEKEDPKTGYLEYLYKLIIVKLPDVTQEVFEKSVVKISQELKKMKVRNHIGFEYDSKLNG